MAAAILLASPFHYDRGMKVSSRAHFETAQAYFDLLIDFDPTHVKVNDWRLKKANSLYFAEDYRQADELYTSLIKDFKVDASILQVASYQRILAREKIFRRFLEESSQSNTDFSAKIAPVEESVLHYANRFAYTGRVVEVLLLAASINRDVGLLIVLIGIGKRYLYLILVRVKEQWLFED